VGVERVKEREPEKVGRSAFETRLEKGQRLHALLHGKGSGGEQGGRELWQFKRYPLRPTLERPG